MHSIRFARTYYIAAFILGAVIALLIVAPARSEEPAFLDHDAFDTIRADEPSRVFSSSGNPMPHSARL
jgi:hypothetical protein